VSVSSLAWIDFDEAERQRTQRIISLFQERESRDELGLGAIRDSIADHLFPGTSTIQTRLRYMLFIPWIFQLLDDREAQPTQLMAEARSLEIGLADALQAGGETLGVIGRDAGPQLRRLPSAVYWAGLGSWGIRRFQGSPDGYFSAVGNLNRRQSRRREGEDEAADNYANQIWHPSLPTAPPSLLKTAMFQLTIDEAQFIIDRLVAEHPQALLTILARKGYGADCRYIWEHPKLAEFPETARRLVRHAEIFSSVMNGAALIYNLQLSELRERDGWIADYQERLQTWSAEIDQASVHGWSLDDFWLSIEHPNHRVQPAAKRFVIEWLHIVRENAAGALNSPAARQLIRDRECRLKTGQSRFLNLGVRNNWRGASGRDRLSFRWPQAKTHLMDLTHAV
jgi:uncharacterized protein DUF6361